MTKPTLLPGGCAQKHGVRYFRFGSPILLFVLVLFGLVSLKAADVTVYSVTKGSRHAQNGDGPPVFLPLNEFVFEARVLSVESNVIRSAMVEGPDYRDWDLVKEDAREFEFDKGENSRHDLNGNFPDGIFRYYIRTRNDGYQPNLKLWLSGAYPATPRILNYSELQSASGTGFVQVSWAPWAGGTAADSIQLRVVDLQGNRAFETRDFGEPGALDGTATSAIIEPSNLAPGRTYAAWLEFRRTTEVNRSGYPGAVGWAYTHRRTEFRIRTSADPVLDLEGYTICKGHNYVQTNLQQVHFDGSNPYVFTASLESTASNLIVGNRFTIPNGESFSAFGENCRPETQLEHTQTSFTQQGLDNLYPDGVYQIDVLTTNQGLRTVSLTLEGADYPPMPRVLNFDPSIPVRTNNALEIRWAPWVGGTTTDFIQFRLLQGCRSIFETGDFGDNDALNGLATNAIVPAGVMEPGETYRASLVFRRYSELDFTSYPGAAGIACYFSRLRFDVSALLDVQEIELAKGRNYLQTNTVEIVPDGTNAFEFLAVVDAQTPTSVTTAELELPNGSPLPLVAAPGDDEFGHAAVSADPLDAVYPAGMYTFKIQTTNDGYREVGLFLPTASFPPAPHFLHDPGARVPPEETNQMRWTAWSGGTTNDFVQLRIRNAGTNVWETPDFGEDDALNGTATNAYIPAGVLTRGVTYSARLIFRRIVDINTEAYPGSVAVSYFFSQTEMDLRTVRPDVEDYEIEKGISFVQTSPTELVPEPGEEFIFNAQVQGSSTGLISSAILLIPNGAISNMTATDVTLEQFELSDVAPSNEVFELNYPSGTYQFEVETSNDGTQLLALVVTNAVYPPVPRISNFTFNTNSPIRAGPPIPLEWDRWLDGTTNDFIQVQIRDSGTNVFETPDFGDPGALNGLSTNVVIPGRLLLPGENYGGRVIFRRFVLSEEPVPGTVGTVSFFTRTKFDISTFDPDVRSYRLFKGVEYVQTSTNTPEPLEYVIDAVVAGRFDNEFQVSALLGVTLTPPGRDPVALTPDDDNLIYTLRESFATRQELEAAYPDGPYVIDIVDGLRYGPTNVTVYLTNDFPNTPHIVNYDAAGRIVASQPFTLEWDKFFGGTVTDYITNRFVHPSGTVAYSTPPPEDQAALNGLRTNTTLNAGTLFANAIYNSSLRFERVLLNDSTTLVEVPGRAGYYAQTAFRAVTTGAGNPPRFSARLFEFVPVNRVQFVVGTIPGGNYVFEGSTNLVNWNLITNITADSEFFTNSVPQPGPAFFIRGSLLR